MPTDKERNLQSEESVFLSAEAGNVSELQRLSHTTPLSQLINKHGSTPLHLSAWKGHLSCCQFLLSCGVDVNATNNENTTPLHCAADGGHYEIIKLLVEAGAEVNSLDTYRYTPLHYSNRNGHHIGSLYLIDHGASTEIKNQNGETPLDIAETFSLRDAIHNEELQRYADIVKSRIDNACPIVITGLDAIHSGELNGRYDPLAMQCGWPAYYHRANSLIRLTYFGDDHHGQWRIQDLSLPPPKNMSPILKISLHSPVYPQDIERRYPSSHWMIRADDNQSHSVWTMMTMKEPYDIYQGVHIEGISSDTNERIES